MAHDLETRDGKTAMWCVGDQDAAWHMLGQRTPNAQTWAAAMLLAGLDWEVEKRKLYTMDKATGLTREISAWGIFRRTDDEFFGSVGASYTPIQNKTAFAFVDALLEAENGAHFESAGALGNGARIWCMANIPAEIRIRGTEDVTKPYLLFTTSHDGSGAAAAKISTVRVVCRNTLNAALSSGGAAMKVYHTVNGNQRLDEARKLMLSAVSDAKSLEEKFNLLAERRMTKNSMLDVLRALFPEPAADAADSTKNRRERIVLKVLEIFDRNDQNAIPEIRGTAWAMLNAYTNYIDHERDNLRVRDGSTIEVARAESAMFGTGADAKSEAFEMIMAATASNPTRSSASVAVLEAPAESDYPPIDQGAVDAALSRIPGLS